MLTIYCTRKLAALLPEGLEKTPEATPPLYSWYANYTTIQRQKVIVAICAETRFGFLLWNIHKADLIDFSGLILAGIRVTLRHYGVNQKVINQYLSSDQPPKVFAATDKRALAQVNTVILDLKYSGYLPEKQELIPFSLIEWLNDIPVISGYSKGATATELMLEKLEE